MAAVTNAGSVGWRHPLNATKSQQRNIPLDPVRAGTPDGSLTDNTVTNPGMETITNKESTPNEITLTASGHKLQVCSCGWEKITSEMGRKGA